MAQRDNETDEAFMERMAKEAAEHEVRREVHTEMTAEHNAWMAEYMLRRFLPLIEHVGQVVQHLKRSVKMQCGFYT